MNLLISLAGLIAYMVAIVASIADSALWFRIAVLVILFAFVNRLTSIEAHLDSHGAEIINQHRAIKNLEDK